LRKNNATVLVTGAAGFLGKPTVRELKKAGYTVISTDRVGNPNLKGDLAHKSFTESLPDVDVVVHCAAVQYVSPDLPFFRRKAYFHRDNIVATRNLVNRYRGKLKYYLQVGTSMMYDQTGLDLYTVGSPLKGVGVYSKSKLESVKIAETIDAPFGVMVPCIIGGDGREGLFRPFVTTIAKFGFVVRPGSGAFPTHMVHVEDAAKLIVLMVEQRATGYYNAAGPDPMSINQWIDTIQSELGKRKVRVIAVPYWSISIISKFSRYRLIAKEQALMLGQSHVLGVDESNRIGWKPEHSNERIVRDITYYILDRKPADGI